MNRPINADALHTAVSLDGAKRFEGLHVCVLMTRCFLKAGAGTRAGPGGCPVGQAAPCPIAPRCRALRCSRWAAAAQEPTQVYVEPRLSLISFHKSLSLVSFSSPTGSQEIELIMFQILEKSGLTGAPSTFPRSGI